MRFRIIDDNDDWTFGRGIQSYAQELQALMLNLKTRILSWVGDCFFDTTANIDWKNLLGVNTRKQIENAVKATTFKTPGVLRINSINIDVDTQRSATIQMVIDTVYGRNVQSLINLSIGGGT